MYNDKINKKDYLIIVIIIISIFAWFLYKDVSYRHNKYVNINDLVNKAYTSSKGYDSYIAKHMSKDTYNIANSYLMYKDLGCKKPIKLSVTLTEINQHKINGKVYVYMLYDFYVLDANGKTVSASLQTPVVFTVTGTNDNLYIENIKEYTDSIDQVPKIYR